MFNPQNPPKSHIRFQKMDIERPRHKSARSIPRPERDNTHHGAALDEAVEVLQHTFEQATQTHPPEFDPALIFRLRLDGYVDEEQWRRSGLTLLGLEKDNSVVIEEIKLSLFRR